MKKYSLTLILVLCLFVITGGTYAAWSNYYDTAIEDANGSSSITVDTATNVSMGTVSVTPNNVVINIVETTENSHTPKLAEITGTFDIKYDAPKGIVSSDVNPAFEYTVTSNKTDYITVKSGTTAIEGLSKNNTTASINAADLEITLVKTEKLTKYTDYTAFKQAIEGVTITLTIKQTEASKVK